MTRFSRPALDDLLDILTYIETNNPARAREFVERIVARCEALARSPLSGRMRPEFAAGVRSVSVRPVVVFYRLGTDDEVEILRIIDGRRDLRTVWTDFD